MLRLIRLDFRICVMSRTKRLQFTVKAFWHPEGVSEHNNNKISLNFWTAAKQAGYLRKKTFFRFWPPDRIFPHTVCHVHLHHMVYRESTPETSTRWFFLQSLHWLDQLHQILHHRGHGDSPRSDLYLTPTLKQLYKENPMSSSVFTAVFTPSFPSVCLSGLVHLS